MPTFLHLDTKFKLADDMIYMVAGFLPGLPACDFYP
jgi:hypothetical protein